MAKRLCPFSEGNENKTFVSEDDFNRSAAEEGRMREVQAQNQHLFNGLNVGGNVANQQYLPNGTVMQQNLGNQQNSPNGAGMRPNAGNQNFQQPGTSQMSYGKKSNFNNMQYRKRG